MDSKTTSPRNELAERFKAIPLSIKAVLLYGSNARNAQTADSDMDLLVVADAVNPRRHRRGKEISLIKKSLALDVPLDILLLTQAETLSNFRNHNPLFLDMASEGVIVSDEGDFLKAVIEKTRDYIKEKNLKKLDDGWTFPFSYRAPAFLSLVSNKDFALAMLADGVRDLEIGKKIMESGYFDKAVYHFQQAVEKAAKAVLICFGVFKKTHFVGEILIKELETRELPPAFSEKLTSLANVSSEIEQEVTWSRYPGIDADKLWIPLEEYTESDATEARDKTCIAVAAAREFVGWWFEGKD